MGEWGVESGEWRVESGEWRVESGTAKYVCHPDEGRGKKSPSNFEGLSISLKR